MVKINENEYDTPAAMPKYEQDLELLKSRQIPLRHRDNCAHILVKLDWCRMDNFYNPTRCTEERHLYEECEYIAWKERVRQKQAIQAKKAAEAKAAAASEAKKAAA